MTEKKATPATSTDKRMYAKLAEVAFEAKKARLAPAREKLIEKATEQIKAKNKALLQLIAKHTKLCTELDKLGEIINKMPHEELTLRQAGYRDARGEFSLEINGQLRDKITKDFNARNGIDGNYAIARAIAQAKTQDELEAILREIEKSEVK